MKDESKCISTEEKITHKLWELKVLSLFMKHVTVNNIEVSLALVQIPLDIGMGLL